MLCLTGSMNIKDVEVIFQRVTLITDKGYETHIPSGSYMRITPI